MTEEAFDARKLLGLLQRRLPVILVTLGLVVGAAFFVTLSITPKYTASSLVLVEPGPKNLLAQDTQSNGSSESSIVDSEVELIQSDANLIRAIRELDLVSDPEFADASDWRSSLLEMFGMAAKRGATEEETLLSVLENLRKVVDVNRKDFTFVVVVEVTSTDPVKAAAIANAIPRTYIRAQLEGKVSATLEGRDIVAARLAEASNEIVEADAQLTEYLSKADGSLINDLGSDELEELATRLDAARTDLGRLRATLAAVEAAIAQGDWPSLASVSGDSDLQALVRGREQSDASSQGTDIGPDLGSPDDQLAVAGRDFADGLRSKIAEADRQVAQLSSDLRAAVLESQLPLSAGGRLYELQQASRVARAQYQTILSALSDFETQSGLQVANSRLASEALPPRNPSYPNRGLIMALTLLLAAGLGILIAFVYDSFIGGFVSQSQLETVLRTQVVETVPRQRGRAQASTHSVADVVVRFPLSVYAEAVRGVRIALEMISSPLDRGRVIMVTSAAPNEGKTTLSLSLARSYALAGRRTLLIDCDLRKPSIHREVDTAGAVSLADRLTNEQEQWDVLEKDPLTDLRLILGSQRSEIPTDHLLADLPFARLIEKARQDFEVIVLDTPPVGVVVDSQRIARYADIVLFAVRWSSTPQSDAGRALAKLRLAIRPGTVLASLLTQEDQSASRARGKYASYYGSGIDSERARPIDS